MSVTTPVFVPLTRADALIIGCPSPSMTRPVTVTVSETMGFGVMTILSPTTVN